MPLAGRVAAVLLAGFALAAAGCGGVSSGAALYAQTCSRCHGASGVPNDAAQKLGMPSFADAAWQRRRTDDELRRKIKGGGGQVGSMPSFERLSPAEIDALVTYVRSLGAAK